MTERLFFESWAAPATVTLLAFYALSEARYLPRGVNTALMR